MVFAHILKHPWLRNMDFCALWGHWVDLRKHLVGIYYVEGAKQFTVHRVDCKRQNYLASSGNSAKAEKP